MTSRVDRGDAAKAGVVLKRHTTSVALDVLLKLITYHRVYKSGVATTEQRLCVAHTTSIHLQQKILCSSKKKTNKPLAFIVNGPK